MIPIKEKKKSAFKSPWVWTIFGLFAVIFTVNYGFVNVALETTSGLVTEEYYKYGLQQNKIDEQYRAQGVRGWKVSLETPKPWKTNTEALISVVVMDKYGTPIDKGFAEVTAYRPSDATADITLELVETKQPGTYQTTMLLPLKGAWDINLLFRKGENKHMLNERIFAKSDAPSQNSKLETVVDFIRQKSAQ